MIKVGDWVKREHADGIARVISIEEDMAVLYTGGVQSCEYLEELTKLPLKFKGFESHEGKINETRHIKSNGKTYNFHATLPDSDGDMQATVREIANGYRVYGVNYCYPENMQEALVWLEHQYATLIAKARGLV